MLDPLTDPRAVDLLAAVPEDVHLLSLQFSRAAGEAHTTAAGLSAAQRDTRWKGHAADAFRTSIGRLPVELTRVRAGYSAVAQALTVYEGRLAEIRRAFVRVTGKLAEVRGQLVGAHAAATGANHALQTLVVSRRPSTRALLDCELTAAQADGTVRGYAREAADLQSQAMALLDEFVAVRSICRDTIAAAQHTAPVRPPIAPGDWPAPPLAPAPVAPAPLAAGR
jgi:hypothetical protein